MGKEIGSQEFVKYVITGSLICFLVIVGVIVYVDPCFHYHAPLNGLGYTLYNERYQNDGIIRNFTYDSVIIGTSMCDNFKTSEFEMLFGGKCIKTPYSAGSYKEIGDSLKRAFDGKKQVKIVFRSLDLWGGEYLLGDKDARERSFVYPDYLYDDNLFNDVFYVLNKSIFIDSIDTMCGEDNISFDEYAYWSDSTVYGKQQVLTAFERAEMYKGEKRRLSNDEKYSIKDNLRQNIIEQVKENPDVEFWLFIPPYSICWWDTIKREGELEYMLEAQKVAMEELLQYQNISLYAFSDRFDWVCNLDNYRDRVHYGGWINSNILEEIYRQSGLITKENYQMYLEEIENFYNEYDYDGIYH